MEHTGLRDLSVLPEQEQMKITEIITIENKNTIFLIIH